MLEDDLANKALHENSYSFTPTVVVEENIVVKEFEKKQISMVLILAIRGILEKKVHFSI